MKLDKSRIYKVFLRVTAVGIAAIVMNVAIISNLGTYSWFTSNAASNAVVRAAETSDLLEIVGFRDELGNEYNKLEKEYNARMYKGIFEDEEQENITYFQNPSYIVLKQKINDASEYKTYNPTIYFEMNGEATQYLDSINPVTMVYGDKIGIPIKIKITAEQYEELSLMPEDSTIQGEIIVKYLNGYIDESLGVELTKEYIIANSGKIGDIVNNVMLQEEKILTLEEILKTELSKNAVLEEEKKILEENVSNGIEKYNILEESSNNLMEIVNELKDKIAKMIKDARVEPVTPTEPVAPTEPVTPAEPETLATPEAPAEEPFKNL